MTIIKATCPSCGDVELSRDQVRLVVHPLAERSFYGFTCTLCGDVVRKPAGDEVVRLLTMGGVVAEAIGGSYTGFGRISEYTGLPTVLGWPGHESQWRGTSAPQGNRAEDIATLYTTPDWGTAQDILSRYNIRYVYIGGLERSTYPVHEDKFVRNMAQVFQQGTVTVYEAPSP